MPFRGCFLILLPLIAALACAASRIPKSAHQLIPKVAISRDIDYSLVSLPNQTIGDYFDSLASEDENMLSERAIHRTQAFTEAIWTDDGMKFNISMSRCVTMSDKAGFYTSKIGNLPNATVQDIIDDLHAHEGSEAANRVEYTSRVKENADLAIMDANNLLGAAITDWTPITPTTDQITTTTHTELRHLLVLAEIAVVIIQSSFQTEILVAFFAGLLGRTTGGIDNLGATLCAIQLFSVQMAMGIRHVVVRRQPVNFITATIFNIFLAWVRDCARAFAGEFLPAGQPSVLPSVAWEGVLRGGKGGNTTTSGGSFSDGSTWPTTQDLVEKALEGLGFTNNPRGRFLAATGFRPGGVCPSRS